MYTRLIRQAGAVAAALLVFGGAAFAEDNAALIARYERDLNIYDFSRSFDPQTMLGDIQKLEALDPQNPTAFRARAYCHSCLGESDKAVNYGNALLKSNVKPLLKMEICCHLGNIFLYEYNDNQSAKIYADQGIAFAKQIFSAAEIEQSVNGAKVEIVDGYHKGTSNTLRELYILKAHVEGTGANSVAVMSYIQDAMLAEDHLTDIKYPTDW